MKQIFTEKEYEEAVKKYNETLKDSFFSDIKNYSIYDGFEDLREYNISDQDFKLLWKCQELLFSYENEKESLCETSKNLYNNIKKLYFQALNN